jgi:hypothetical protein
MRVEEVTPDKIERWHARVCSADVSPLSNRTRNKLVVPLHGVYRRARQVYGLPRNPVAGVERGARIGQEQPFASAATTHSPSGASGNRTNGKLAGRPRWSAP